MQPSPSAETVGKRIDALRRLMQVRENPGFTKDYYAADKRYIGNALQVFFTDGSATPRIQVDVPIGHRRRRAEGRPLLVQKFEAAVAAHFAPKQSLLIQSLFVNPAKLDAMSVNEFMSALVTNG